MKNNDFKDIYVINYLISIQLPLKQAQVEDTKQRIPLQINHFAFSSKSIELEQNYFCQINIYKKKAYIVCILYLFQTFIKKDIAFCYLCIINGPLKTNKNCSNFIITIILNSMLFLIYLNMKNNSYFINPVCSSIVIHNIRSSTAQLSTCVIQPSWLLPTM